MNFSMVPGIDCKKPFFEIRPGSRFSEMITIFVPMGLYMDQNRNQLEKATFWSNFEKRFCNRFLKAWQISSPVVDNSEKIGKFLYDPEKKTDPFYSTKMDQNDSIFNRS